MRETDDGFVIAEADLKLRGSGEVLGTRQSGVASFRLADLAQHADLLQAARDAGLGVKLHADQLGTTGGAELAASSATIDTPKLRRRNWLASGTLDYKQPRTHWQRQHNMEYVQQCIL